MSVVVVEPPAALVRFEEAKLWAPVFGDDEDMRVKALLAASQAAIEPPKSWVGASFGLQTLEARLDGFGCDRRIPLPFPPVVDVISVQFDDAGGAEQALPTDVWRKVGMNTSSSAIELRAGRSWPATACASEAVRIRYRAGHPEGGAQLEPVRQAVVLGAIRLRALSTEDLALRSVETPGVSTRTYVVSDMASRLVAEAVDSLLAPFRVWSL